MNITQRHPARLSFPARLPGSRITTEAVSRREKWLGYVVGPVGAFLLNSILTGYINIFYTDVLGVGYMWSGMFLFLFPILSKVINAVTNLAIGRMIDRTRGVQGKARPWILISAPFVAVSAVLVFLVPQGNDFIRAAWIILSYNLYFSFAFSVYSMSHSLMVPLSTRDVKQRGSLSVLSNVSNCIIAGGLMMIFPIFILPAIGVNQGLWILVIGVIGMIALPLIILEYCYTRERITEEAVQEATTPAISARQNIKACFGNVFWVLILAYTVVNLISTSVRGTSLIYYCNWVLGSYNDGVTQATVSMIGSMPLGIGVLAAWPLCKRFGKRNMTLIGFILSVIGGVICLTGPENMTVMLVGQFVKSIGCIPATYVFSALVADALDHVEWKSGFRCDGFSASILSVVGTVAAGLSLGVFNLMLGKLGYMAPVAGSAVAAQNEAVKNFFVFGFVGMDVICNILLIGILAFLGIEKVMPKVHSEIQARRAAQG